MYLLACLFVCLHAQEITSDTDGLEVVDMGVFIWCVMNIQGF